MARVTRREFTIRTAIGAGVVLTSRGTLWAGTRSADFGGHVVQPPDAVAIEFDSSTESATRSGTTWGARDAVVETRSSSGSLAIRLHAPSSGIRRIRLIWNVGAPAGARILNDAWERGYGDLSWQGADAARILPWYAVVFDGQSACGFGVRTPPGALCSWRLSAAETQLVCDVRLTAAAGASGLRFQRLVRELRQQQPRADTARCRAAG